MNIYIYPWTIAALIVQGWWLQGDLASSGITSIHPSIFLTACPLVLELIPAVNRREAVASHFTLKHFESLLVWLPLPPPPLLFYTFHLQQRRETEENWDSTCASASFIRWWRKKHLMTQMCLPSVCLKLLTLKLTVLWRFVFADILVACDWSQLAARHRVM